MEPHIEQGPVLEAEGLPIGVVTGIQGVRWFNVTVTGEPGHAGTVPHAIRRDAFQATLRAVSALSTLMEDPDDVVRFTVGHVSVVPSSPNTIPSSVRFSIDFRHPERGVLDARPDRGPDRPGSPAMHGGGGDDSLDAAGGLPGSDYRRDRQGG
ncbi:MAG: peptidase dimerization domain-containing protein [Tepidamorphaceae bacterium]